MVNVELLGQDAIMFLGRNRRTVDGQIYEYWILMRTLRTAKVPRQAVVASLSKNPRLDVPNSGVGGCN